VSLVKTQNQIDAAAADGASALLLYLRDARRAEALVPTRHKRMLGCDRWRCVRRHCWTTVRHSTHLFIRSSKQLL